MFNILRSINQCRPFKSSSIKAKVQQIVRFVTFYLTNYTFDNEKIINKTYYISLKIPFKGITRLNTSLHFMSEKYALTQKHSDVKHNYLLFMCSVQVLLIQYNKNEHSSSIIICESIVFNSLPVPNTQCQSLTCIKLLSFKRQAL